MSTFWPARWGQGEKDAPPFNFLLVLELINPGLDTGAALQEEVKDVDPGQGQLGLHPGSITCKVVNLKLIVHFTLCLGLINYK